MLASVARVLFRFRRAKNLDYERALFSMNADERISKFSSSAVYLPLRLSIRAQKFKVFLHMYVYIGWNVQFVARVDASRQRIRIDSIGISGTNTHRAAKEPKDWLKRKRGKEIV